MKYWQEAIEENEKIIEVDLDRLKQFHDHPFHVQEDRQMKQLKDSITKYGILTPLLVRPTMEGFYEIISGHRRLYVAKSLGYKKVPVIIRILNESEAVICMVDSNIQREHISYSEKAFAYKMKSEAMKKLDGRFIGGQVDHKGKRTIDILGEESGESAKQVQRYLKLTELIPELLEKLDDGIISFSPAVELAYLTEDEQKLFLDAMEYTQALPSLSQAQRIKELGKCGELTLSAAIGIMGEVKRGDTNRVMFKNEQLYQYFPRKYTPEMMKKEILEILKQYMSEYSKGEGTLCAK